MELKFSEEEEFQAFLVPKIFSFCWSSTTLSHWFVLFHGFSPVEKIVLNKFWSRRIVWKIRFFQDFDKRKQLFVTTKFMEKHKERRVASCVRILSNAWRKQFVNLSCFFLKRKLQNKELHYQSHWNLSTSEDQLWRFSPQIFSSIWII